MRFCFYNIYRFLFTNLRKKKTCMHIYTMKYNKQKRESKEKAKSSWQEFVSYYVKIPRNHNKYIGYGDRQRCKRKEGWWGGLHI